MERSVSRGPSKTPSAKPRKFPGPSASSATQKKRVFVVDDHPIVRDALARLINMEPDLMVAGEREDPHQALADLARSKYDVAIVDLSLKDGDGLDLLKTIKDRFPKLPVLVLSAHEESLYGERALRAGARGYIMKGETSASLVAAIRKVLSGGLYVSDDLKIKMLENYAGGRPQLTTSLVDRLSDRELEVFQWLGRGLGTRQIAEKLCLGIKTVEAYRGHIKEKLGLENAAKLVHRAVQWVQESQNLASRPPSAPASSHNKPPIR